MVQTRQREEDVLREEGINRSRSNLVYVKDGFDWILVVRLEYGET